MIKQHLLQGHGPLTPYGFLVHTTGNGIPAKAKKDGLDLYNVTVDVYKNMGGADGVGPHYAITPDGRIAQFREPNEKAWHAGTTNLQRRDFLSGAWETDYNRYAATDGKDLISWWKTRWPGVKSPQHLFPGESPNDAYVGVELVPCGVVEDRKFVPVYGFGATPKSRFTPKQYFSLALLAEHLAQRFSWPDAWEQTGRLVGHEDVNLYSRPGWDPGAYQGWFDWSLFRGILQSIQLHFTKNTILGAFK